MKKKLIKSVIMCLIILGGNVLTDSMVVKASSGKLRSASICQDANGTYYGQHSSDNHWHMAVYHEGSGWYPNGGIVPGTPCNTSSEVNAQTNNDSEDTSTDTNVDNSNSTNNTNINTDNNEPTNKNNVKELDNNIQEEKEENTKPQIKAKNKVELKSSEMKADLNKNDIVELFEIEVTDEGKKIDNSKIILSPSTIPSGFKGSKDIVISYKDSGGLEASQKVNLVINKADTDPKIITSIEDTDLVIDSSEIPQNTKELIELLGLEIVDAEDGNINVTQENIKIDQEEEILTITAKDSDDNVVKQEITYSIIDSESSINAMLTIILILLVGFIGVFLFLGWVFYVIFIKESSNKKSEINN